MHLSHLLVPGLDPIVNPVDEPLTKDDAEAVGRVLSRPLQHLLGRREELAHLLELGGEGEHLGDLQGLVERHGDVLDALPLDDLDQTYSSGCSVN